MLLLLADDLVSCFFAVAAGVLEPDAAVVLGRQRPLAARAPLSTGSLIDVLLEAQQSPAEIAVPAAAILPILLELVRSH